MRNGIFHRGEESEERSTRVFQRLCRRTNVRNVAAYLMLVERSGEIAKCGG